MMGADLYISGGEGEDKYHFRDNGYGLSEFMGINLGENWLWDELRENNPEWFDPELLRGRVMTVEGARNFQEKVKEAKRVLEEKDDLKLISPIRETSGNQEEEQSVDLLKKNETRAEREANWMQRVSELIDFLQRAIDNQATIFWDP